MKEWITSIWTNPKSTMTALIAAGMLTATLAQNYPTAKWLGVAATVLGGVVKLFGKD